MSYLMSFLKDYKFEPITNPVMEDGKPVGFILDGGHGTRQYTAGKRSPDGSLIEGEWNREIVARLVPCLRALGFETRILVPDDTDMGIKERAEKANQIMKKEPKYQWYYLSIHINAASYPNHKPQWINDASGFCAYTSKNASEKSRKFAKTLASLARNDFGLKGNRSLPKEGHWMANYTVIYNTKMPAVLTENLFMTNQKECEFLKSEKGKETITSLHVAAICKNFGIPYAHVVG